MSITAGELVRIMPALHGDEHKINLHLPFLNAAMHEFDISSNTRRAAAFLAQIAHETGQLRYLQEIWGPTPQQRKYEPPSALATELGNRDPGDGYRYRGRGAFQLTGRGNYRKYGRLLGLDLEANPQEASKPQLGYRIAGAYWNEHHISDPADRGAFKEVTRLINGGLTGLPDRELFYARAKRVLGI